MDRADNWVRLGMALVFIALVSAGMYRAGAHGPQPSFAGTSERH